MNKQSRLDQISEFMDGELKPTAARFAFKRLCADSEAQDYWHRMHMIRQAMRDGEAVHVPTDFLGGVQAAIADDQLVAGQSAGRRKNSSRWLRPVAGMGVAASVAVAALIGINQAVLDGPEALTASSQVPGNTDVIAEAPAFVTRSNALERGLSAQAVPVSFSEDPQMERRRLNDYLLRHSQLTSGSGHVGFVSYIPLVGSSVEIDTQGKQAQFEIIRPSVPTRTATESTEYTSTR